MTHSDLWSIPGGVYHVMNRGNRRSRIFEDDRDRKRFVRLLVESKSKHGVDILAGTQMWTHFHLCLCTPHGNLSAFMQDLEGRFARYSNWRHGNVGHLFQRPFRRVYIDSDLHLFIVAAYIFNNPVEARYVTRPEDWKWSTYAATAGFAPTPSYLSTTWIETLFPSHSLAGSQQLLRRCIEDPRQILSYIQVAEPATESAIRSYIAHRRALVEQPCSFSRLIRPALPELLPFSLPRSGLRSSIAVAHERHGYRLAEIARHLGVHRATVSKWYRSVRPQQSA